MTSTVTSLTRSIDKSLIARLFAKFKGRYGNLWTSRGATAEEWDFILDDWLSELCSFKFEELRAAVKNALSIFPDFPPTLGQLVNLCLKEAGLPSQQEVIRLMVKREFTHPLVKMIYDKIGSFTVKNGKEEDINHKVKNCYAECLADFHCYPEVSWKALNDYNSIPKKLSPPDKILTSSERKGFKERLAEYQKIVNAEKSKLTENKPIEFDEKEIQSESSRYKAHCDYLLSVPERLVLGLTPKQAYHRQRLLNRGETAKHLREAGYVSPEQREGYEASKSYNNKPIKMYKNWIND